MTPDCLSRLSTYGRKMGDSTRCVTEKRIHQVSNPLRLLFIRFGPGFAFPDWPSEHHVPFESSSTGTQSCRWNSTRLHKAGILKFMSPANLTAKPISNSYRSLKNRSINTARSVFYSPCMIFMDGTLVLCGKTSSLIPSTFEISNASRSLANESGNGGWRCFANRSQRLLFVTSTPANWSRLASG
ncbi:hypothetical protein RB4897 [Rhodopirellula baltica SH 1]|uniref:Uncharacterized protein n=1 Tax=Rhodopirellula baltica (strain DSM 10527 / NCIMB 13988 / SH1) TaxID=243090 RepID=Q7UH18_RHOBA|nr:hypothetical protein RB4897 [Rhodopirellula baltica SH 1]